LFSYLISFEDTIEWGIEIRTQIRNKKADSKQQSKANDGSKVEIKKTKKWKKYHGERKEGTVLSIAKQLLGIIVIITITSRPPIRLLGAEKHCAS
jgi:hypothetical protein